MFLQFLDETGTENPEVMDFINKQVQRAMITDMIMYSLPVIIITLIILHIHFKHRDEEVGIKGYGKAQFFTKITILIYILLIIFLWFGNYKMNNINQIYLIALPAFLIFSAQTKNIKGIIKEVIFAIIGGIVVMLIFKLIALFLKVKTVNTIYKVLVTLYSLMCLSQVNKYAYKGWHKGKIKVTRKRHNYSASNSYSQASSYSPSYNTPNNEGLFTKDLQVRYNSFTGKNEYYQNGKLVATGEKNYITDNEDIKDLNGNTILKKRQGFLNDYVYEDNHGNTIYKENHDYFTGGSNVTDNNYNKVSSHDPWDDIFNFGKNYKK